MESLVWLALAFFINSSYTVFLATLFFTTSLSLLKLTEVFPSLRISNLPISYFKPAKSTFLVNFDVSALAVFFKSAFIVLIIWRFQLSKTLTHSIKLWYKQELHMRKFLFKSLLSSAWLWSFEVESGSL